MAYKQPIRRLAQGPLARQPSYGCPARRFARDSAAHAMTEYTPASASPPTLMAQVRDAIRLRHYSQRTERASASWIRERRATLGRHRQAGNVRFLAAFIRNPSFGCGLRHPLHSAIARPSRCQHDDDPHARHLRFRPAAPSDHLKMRPWWNEAASRLADDIRGKVKQGTLWLISEEDEKNLRAGISAWLSGVSPISV